MNPYLLFVTLPTKFLQSFSKTINLTLPRRMSLSLSLHHTRLLSPSPPLVIQPRGVVAHRTQHGGSLEFCSSSAGHSGRQAHSSWLLAILPHQCCLCLCCGTHCQEIEGCVHRLSWSGEFFLNSKMFYFLFPVIASLEPCSQ